MLGAPAVGAVIAVVAEIVVIERRIEVMPMVAVEIAGEAIAVESAAAEMAAAGEVAANMAAGPPTPPPI